MSLDCLSARTSDRDFKCPYHFLFRKVFRFFLLSLNCGIVLFPPHVLSFLLCAWRRFVCYLQRLAFTGRLIGVGCVGRVSVPVAEETTKCVNIERLVRVIVHHVGGCVQH